MRLLFFLIEVFWVMDILNLPFMEMFDTTIPLNTVFWILMIIIVSTYSEGYKYK